MKTVHIGSKLHIRPEEVMLLKADINYSEVFFKNGKKKLVSTNLKKIESRLESHGFFRTHRSYLINLDSIDSIAESEKFLTMINGAIVLVSKRKKSGLFQSINNH
ncbi:MAG: LytR/AlgR family response regulator transcription factor [Leadbetterella sp.]